MTKRRRSKRMRTQTGSLVVVFGMGFVLAAFIICALALDIGHFVSVKAELQKTTDAAALAGAQEFKVSDSRVKPSAFAVAAMNTADGKIVSNDTPDTTVEVEILPPTPEFTKRCKVTAHMRINNMFAGLFGRSTDVATAVSIAGAAGTLTELNGGQAFPLAVSIDAIPGTYHGPNAGLTSAEGAETMGHHFVGKPLNQAQLGDLVTFYINSQQYKNAAWTSFTIKPTSGSYIKSAIDQCLGFDPKKTVEIPDVKAGDEIYLNNGVLGQKALANDPYFSALIQEPVLYLPVIKGNPPYNQHRTCIGFIGVKVESIDVNQAGGVVEAIHCRLVRALANGRGGPIPSTGDETNDDALNRLALGPIKLIM